MLLLGFPGNHGMPLETLKNRLDVKMYNVMVNGLCKEGLFDDAMSLLSEMEDNCCTPNAVTFQTLIHALFESNKNDKAVELLREMIARGLL